MHSYSAALALIVALTVTAEVATAQPAAPDLPVAVAMVTDNHAGGTDITIEDAMQSFISSSGFADREKRGEIAVLSGVAVVDVPSTNPQWVAHRSLAYERALLEAQADYVIRQSAQITTQSISDVYKAAGLEPPPYQSPVADNGKSDELIRKLVALGTGRIDKGLRDLNINPADYESKPEPQRFLQLKETLRLRSMERGFGELTGLTPVQTFEKRAEGGAYKIGVVAVVSSRMKDFAQRVLTDRGQFQADPAHASNLADLYADKAALTQDFGVRWRYDQNGMPVLISFSQWMSDYRGTDPIIAERYRDVAFKQAEARADGQIAEFLKGNVNVVRSAETGQEITEAADRMPDEYVAQQPEMRKLVNAYLANIRRESRVTVTGISTLSRWSANHPETGQPIVGVIRMWSATGEQAVRLQRDGPPPAAAAAGNTPSGPGTVRSGQKLMDATDF